MPKAGIEAIPRQLKANLTRTTFQFNTKVISVEDDKIRLADGTELESHFTIIATEPSALVHQLKNQKTKLKSCNTLYFETSGRRIEKPIIGLIANKDALIDNIIYHGSLESDSVGKEELLSVTVVKQHDLTDEALKTQVQKELKQHCGVDAPGFIKQYFIPKALPELQGIQYELPPSETRVSKGVFLAGDTLLNGSLNAAMISGERAALGIIQSLGPDLNFE